MFRSPSRRVLARIPVQEQTGRGAKARASLAWQSERASDGSAAGSAQPEASEVEEGTLPASAARPVAPLWISAQEATQALSLQSTIESDTGEPLLSLRLRGIWQVQAVAQPDALGLRVVLEEPSPRRVRTPQGVIGRVK